MISFKKFTDITNKVSKKLNIPKNVALKALQKAQEKGINLVKWQQYLTMITTFANTMSEQCQKKHQRKNEKV